MLFPNPTNLLAYHSEKYFKKYPTLCEAKQWKRKGKELSDLFMPLKTSSHPRNVT
jgi:hypothetical protein